MSGLSIAERIKQMQNQASETPTPPSDKPEPKRLSVSAMSIPLGGFGPPGVVSPRSFSIGSNPATPLGSGSHPKFGPSSQSSTTSENSTGQDPPSEIRRGSVASLGRSLNIPIGMPQMGGMMRSRSGTLTSPLHSLPENEKIASDKAAEPLTVDLNEEEAPKISHYRRATLSSKNRRRPSTLRGVMHDTDGLDDSRGQGSGQYSVYGSRSESESGSTTPAGTLSRTHSRRVSLASFDEFTPRSRRNTEFTFPQSPILSEANETEEPITSKVIHEDSEVSADPIPNSDLVSTSSAKIDVIVEASEDLATQPQPESTKTENSTDCVTKEAVPEPLPESTSPIVSEKTPETVIQVDNPLSVIENSAEIKFTETCNDVGVDLQLIVESETEISLSLSVQ